MENTKTKLNNYKLQVVWENILMMVVFHSLGFYGIYVMFNGNPKSYTLIFELILAILSTIGVSAGAHRLWSHRSYKAKAPLKIFLVFFHTCVYEKSIIKWSRDHRAHHKYADTNGDPHNVTRGLFFSHIGWTMAKKHPDVIEKGKGIDLSDLYNDPFVRFQHEYYFILMPIASVVLPMVIPMYCWDETFLNANCINLVRYLIIVHNTLAINSVAHRFGCKPYDRSMEATDSLGISAITLGEGFHNYHHAFPWDYRSAEFGSFSLNLSRSFIELCAKIGWAYDLKAASDEIIKNRVRRTGDGSHALWGWGDKDQHETDVKAAIIFNKQADILS